jgi:hypothetical protein
MFSFLLGKYLQVELSGNRVGIYLVLKFVRPLSKEAVPVVFQTTKSEYLFCLLHLLANILCY